MASSPYDRKRGSRLIARVFALLALAGVTVVLVAVISNSLEKSDGTTSQKTATVEKPKHHKPADPFYVVQAGDTFSGIAASEHITRSRLDRLNSDRGIDPNLLQPNQCLNVVPDGCKKLGSGG